MYVCPIARVRDDIHWTGHLKIFFMDLTFDFETYWNRIGGDINFANRKAATEIEWAKHPDKHKPIILWLVEHGTYPQRNPFFFIQDFKIKCPKGQPTNYRGKTAPKEPIFSAMYNGKWGMYTQADIDTYHMEVYIDPNGQK